MVVLVGVCGLAMGQGAVKHRSVGPSISRSEYESDQAIYLDGGGTGDMVYYDTTTGSLVGLVIGSEGYGLRVRGGLPAWESVVDGSAYLATSTTAAPVYHYRLNDQDGGYNVDDSGISNSDLTANAADTSWTATGKIGRAFFTSATAGSAIYLSSGFAAWANKAIDRPYTVTAWLYPLSTDDQYAFGHSSGGDSTRNQMIGIRNGRFMASNNDSTAAIDATATASTGTWTHVTAVYGTSSIILYVNGVSRGSSSYVQSDNDNYIGLGSPYRAGVGFVNDPWVGGIDDARIYDYALGVSEIEAIYNVGFGTEASATSGTEVSASSIIIDQAGGTYAAAGLTSEPSVLYFGAGERLVGRWTSDTLHIYTDIDGSVGEATTATYAVSAGSAGSAGSADTATTASYSAVTGVATTATVSLDYKDKIVHADGSSTLSLEDSAGTGEDILRLERASDSSATKFLVHDYGMFINGSILADASGASDTTGLIITGGIHSMGFTTADGGLDITGAFSAVGIDAGSERVTSVDYPTTATDAATKKYVDDQQSVAVALGTTPYAQFSMDDNAANTLVTDSSGNGNDAVFSRNTENVSTTTAKLGRAFYFDSDTETLDQADFTGPATTEISLGVWFNGSVDYKQHQYLILPSGMSVRFVTPVLTASARVEVALPSPYTVQVELPGSPLDNTWHHLFVRVKSGYGYDIWLDGVKVASDYSNTGTWSISAGNYKMFYGTLYNHRLTDMYLDDYRFYNTWVSDELIDAVYNAESGTTDAGVSVDVSLEEVIVNSDQGTSVSVSDVTGADRVSIGAGGVKVGNIDSESVDFAVDVFSSGTVSGATVSATTITATALSASAGTVGDLSATTVTAGEVEATTITATSLFGDGVGITGIQQGSAIYDLFDDACTVWPEYRQLSLDAPGAEATVSTTVVTTTQSLGGWVTCKLGITQLADSISHLHLHAQQTAGADVSIYYNLYKRSAAGVNTLIAQSSDSDPLTGDIETLDIYAQIHPTALDETDILLLELVAKKVGTGVDPQVTIYLEGTDRRSWYELALPSNNFVTYTNAIKDVDLGDNSIAASGFEGRLRDGDGDTYVEPDPAGTDSDDIQLVTAGTVRQRIDSDIDFFEPVSITTNTDSDNVFFVEASDGTDVFNLDSNSNRTTVYGDLVSTTIHQVSDDGLHFGMTFNSETTNSTTVFDSSRYAHNGTVSGATLTAGSYNGSSCFDFDGTDDRIDISSVLPIAFDTDAFTVSMWVKAGSTVENNQFFSLSDADNTNNFIAFRILSGGTLNYIIRGTGVSVTQSATGTYDDNEWHHVVATYDNPNLIVYADGENVGSTTGDASSINTSLMDSAYLGYFIYSVADYYFDGCLDSPMIYDRVLSAEEVSQLYHQRAEVMRSPSAIEQLSINTPYTTTTLNVGGDGRFTGDVYAGGVMLTSDKFLKYVFGEALTTATVDTMASVLTSTPILYRLHTDPTTAPLRLGYRAQDLPELVRRRMPDGYLGIDQGALMAYHGQALRLLVRETRDQRQEINQLKTAGQALNQRLVAVETWISNR